MTVDREDVLPAGAPPPSALPPALRACLRSLALDLTRLAALLTQYAREEEDRRAGRRRRRGRKPS